MKRIFTSESVTEGHPDKVCDICADSVLDAYLAKDPDTRCACEVVVTTDFMCVFGEVTSLGDVDIERTVRDAVKNIGYDKSVYGFNADTFKLDLRLHSQSPDIAMGVNRPGMAAGAGDQGMMFGYACNETESLMPLPISLAHGLTKKLSEVRKSGVVPYLGPDGKSQVSVEYDNGVPVRVDAVVLSSQHDEGVKHGDIGADLLKNVIKTVIPERLLDKNTKIFINPTGNFVIGGPNGDSGLTGRKIIVDTYGGYCPHGGGAFSGKDSTKVDRSAAYMARYVCKNIVAAGLADKCEVQLSYAIGVVAPTSVYIDTFGTGKIGDDKIAAAVSRLFDLRPYAIIKKLELQKPVFTKTAAYGHFGRDCFKWEQTDLAAELKKSV